VDNDGRRLNVLLSYSICSGYHRWRETQAAISFRDSHILQCPFFSMDIDEQAFSDLLESLRKDVEASAQSPAQVTRGSALSGS
jgi:predicted lipase